MTNHDLNHKVLNTWLKRNDGLSIVADIIIRSEIEFGNKEIAFDCIDYQSRQSPDIKDIEKENDIDFRCFHKMLFMLEKEKSILDQISTLIEFSAIDPKFFEKSGLFKWYIENIKNIEDIDEDNYDYEKILSFLIAYLPTNIIKISDQKYNFWSSFKNKEPFKNLLFFRSPRRIGLFFNKICESSDHTQKLNKYLNLIQSFDDFGSKFSTEQFGELNFSWPHLTYEDLDWLVDLKCLILGTSIDNFKEFDKDPNYSQSWWSEETKNFHKENYKINQDLNIIIKYFCDNLINDCVLKDFDTILDFVPKAVLNLEILKFKNQFNYKEEFSPEFDIQILMDLYKKELTKIKISYLKKIENQNLKKMKDNVEADYSHYVYNEMKFSSHLSSMLITLRFLCSDYLTSENSLQSLYINIDGVGTNFFKENLKKYKLLVKKTLDIFVLYEESKGKYGLTFKDDIDSHYITFNSYFLNALYNLNYNFKSNIGSDLAIMKLIKSKSDNTEFKINEFISKESYGIDALSFLLGFRYSLINYPENIYYPQVSADEYKSDSISSIYMKILENTLELRYYEDYQDDMLLYWSIYNFNFRQNALLNQIKAHDLENKQIPSLNYAFDNNKILNLYF